MEKKILKGISITVSEKEIQEYTNRLIVPEATNKKQKQILRGEDK